MYSKEGDTLETQPNATESENESERKGLKEDIDAKKNTWHSPNRKGEETTHRDERKRSTENVHVMSATNFTTCKNRGTSNIKPVKEGKRTGVLLVS